MNNLLFPYGIEREEFKDVLLESGGVVAGSFVLAGYLEENGVNPGYIPGDIDIWVEGYLEFQLIYGYIYSLGYTVSKKFDRSLFSEKYNDRFIKKVASFFNFNGREVQIIQLFSINPMDYIKENFDISACITWWDLGDDKLKTAFPEENLKKQIFSTKEIDFKRFLRVVKYIKRDFELIKKNKSTLVRLLEVPIYLHKFGNYECRNYQIYYVKSSSIKNFYENSTVSIKRNIGKRKIYREF
jgi:hypothetical protein